MNKFKSIDQYMYLVTGWKLYTFHKGTNEMCEYTKVCNWRKYLHTFKLHNVQDNSKSVQKLWENSLFLTSMSQSRKQESTHCSQESRQPGYCSHSSSSVWRRYCCQRRAPPSHPGQHNKTCIKQDSHLESVLQGFPLQLEGSSNQPWRKCRCSDQNKI